MMAKVTGSVSECNVALFEWAIQRDSMKCITSERKVLASPLFQFFGSTWCIGAVTKSEDHPGNVVVCLCRRDATPLHALSISLRFGVRKGDGSVEEGETHTVRGGIPWTDWVKLLSHADLELLPSDTLTVTCRMEMADEGERHKKDVVSTAVQCVGNDDITGLETLSSDLAQLLSGEKRCDVKLQLGDREFPAHRAVLVARSSVFEAMFRKDTAEEQTGVVAIQDCDPESFGGFLHFLYGGKFDVVTSDNALHLYVTADKYDVRELKEFCLRYARQNVRVENVCQVVNLADQYDETELMSAAQSFFNEKAEDILQTSEWLRFLAKNHRLANKLLLSGFQARSNKT